METRLKTIANVKEMTAKAYQGGGNVVVEFQAGSDLDRALEDVRNKVADAEPDLPEGADEPTVQRGEPFRVPGARRDAVWRRSRARADRRRRASCATAIEEVPGVLEAALKGVRDDLVEVIIDPMRLSSYGLQLDQVIAGVGANNSLIAAGSIEGSEGRYAIKIPSLIETAEDVGEPADRRRRQRRGARPRPRHGARDLQGPGDHHPRQRPARDRHRGLQAHRRQPDRDRRRA